MITITIITAIIGFFIFMPRVRKYTTLFTDNKVYTAITFRFGMNGAILKIFEKVILKKLFWLYERLSQKHIRCFTIGMFKNLTADRINSLDMIDYEWPAEAGDLRCWVNYNYLKGQYENWCALMDKGDTESEEFERMRAFSHKDSLETKLLSIGIKEKELGRTYLFYTLDYKSPNDTILPYALIRAVENRKSWEKILRWDIFMKKPLPLSE